MVSRNRHSALENVGSAWLDACLSESTPGRSGQFGAPGDQQAGRHLRTRVGHSSWCNVGNKPDVIETSVIEISAIEKSIGTIGEIVLTPAPGVLA